MPGFSSINATLPTRTYLQQAYQAHEPASLGGDEVDGFFPTTITRHDLRAGDILLYCNEPEHPTLSHTIIVAGQALSRPFRSPDNNGNSSLVHALIWAHTPGNPLRDTPDGQGEVEIVEMAGGTQSARGGELQAGLYRVYRPRDERLGVAAAQIGMCWAESGRQLPYSRRRAMNSALVGSTFTDKAQRDVARYAHQAFETPPPWGDKGSFCSHFVMAAYQAGAYHLETQSAPRSTVEDRNVIDGLTGALRARAKHVTVRKLDGLLRNDADQFISMGHLRVNEDEVTSMKSTLPAAAREQASRTWFRPW